MSIDRLPSALVLALIVLSTASHAGAADILIVTDQKHPVHGIGSARVIELDTPLHMESALSIGLPSDPRQAAAVVHQRLHDDNGKQAKQLAAAYQGIADAWSLGVTTIPAVVVDRHYVVYGDTDVARAMTRIQAYREAHP